MASQRSFCSKKNQHQLLGEKKSTIVASIFLCSRPPKWSVEKGGILGCKKPWGWRFHGNVDGSQVDVFDGPTQKWSCILTRNSMICIWDVRYSNYIHRNSGMDDVEHHTMQLVTDRRFSGHSGHRTPHLSPGMSLSMQGSQVRGGCYLRGDVWMYVYMTISTSSTAQGGGGSFKNRKRIGKIGCCESQMSDQKHWPTD